MKIFQKFCTLLKYRKNFYNVVKEFYNAVNDFTILEKSFPHLYIYENFSIEESRRLLKCRTSLYYCKPILQYCKILKKKFKL